MARKQNAMWGWALGLGAVGAAVFFSMRKRSAQAQAATDLEAAQAALAQAEADAAAASTAAELEAAQAAFAAAQAATAAAEAAATAAAQPEYTTSAEPQPAGPYGQPGSVFDAVVAQLPTVLPSCSSSSNTRTYWLGLAPDGGILAGSYPTTEEAHRVVPAQAQSYLLVKQLVHSSGAECGWRLIDAVGDPPALVALIRDQVNPQGVPVYGHWAPEPAPPVSVYTAVASQLPPTAPASCAYKDNTFAWLGVAPDGSFSGGGAFSNVQQAHADASAKASSYFIARELQHSSGSECGFALIDAVGDPATIIGIVQDEFNSAGVPVYASLFA